MRILTDSHGTYRTADVIHIGLTVTVWEWLTAGLVSFFFFLIWLFGVAAHAVNAE
jgi:nitrate reductase NapE component